MQHYLILQQILDNNLLIIINLNLILNLNYYYFLPTCDGQ